MWSLHKGSDFSVLCRSACSESGLMCIEHSIFWSPVTQSHMFSTSLRNCQVRKYINCCFIAAIKHHGQDNLYKTGFIWTSSSREVKVHHQQDRKAWQKIGIVAGAASCDSRSGFCLFEINFILCVYVFCLHMSVHHVCTVEVRRGHQIPLELELQVLACHRGSSED